MDISAATEIVQRAQGIDAPVFESVDDIPVFVEMMREAGHPLQYLDEQECAAIRGLLPRIELDMEETMNENELY